MLFDVREAVRSVRRQTRFPVLVCVILALGIGATTLAFGNSAVLLINSSIQHPERLGWIFSVDTHRANDRASVSLPDFLSFRDRAQTFGALGASARTTATITGHGQASRLGAWQVTANLLGIWGLRVGRGRTFREGEDLPEAPRVVVISNRLWQTLLGGDPSVVGSSITLDGTVRTIVGVLEPRVDNFFPSVDLWVPFDLAAGGRGPRDARSVTVVGVLKPGVTVARAHAEVHALALQLAAEHPETNRGWDARVVDTMTGRTGPQTYYNLFLESVASSLVLFTGCVSVGLLLTSRGIARQQEFRIRMAVGASRLSIIRQHVFEGILIAPPAACLGFGLAALAVTLQRMSADPYYTRVEIGGQMFGFAAGMSLLAPLIFGMVPAVQLSRGRTPLTTGGWTEGQSAWIGRRLQRTLVTTQLGAVLILLIVTSIVLRSLMASIATDVGFETSQIATVGLALPSWKYPERHALSQSFIAFVDRVSEMPGVLSAAASSVNPALTAGPAVAVSLDSEALSVEHQGSVQLAVVTPRLFDTVGIQVLAGRDFTPRDAADTPLVAIVNRQFALRYGDAFQHLVGRRLSIRAEPRLREIVGVVGNIRNLTEGDVPPFVYLPHTQEPQRTMFLVTRIPEGYSLEPVRRALADVDADVAPYQLRTFREWKWVRQSGDVAMFGEFGVLAAVSALLAALSLFGVFMCFVGQRRRDIAVRLALGASARDIGRMVFKEGLITVIPGVVAGVFGGALMARFAIGVVYGITANPYDPIGYGASVLLLFTTAVVGLSLPAYRARCVNVAEILRST